MIDTGLSATYWHSRIYQYLVTKAMIGGCNEDCQDTFLAEKYLEGIDKASATMLNALKIKPFDRTAWLASGCTAAREFFH